MPVARAIAAQSAEKNSHRVRQEPPAGMHAHLAAGSDDRFAKDGERSKFFQSETEPDFFVGKVTFVESADLFEIFARGEQERAGREFVPKINRGKNLYVDDLVTRDADRSRGFGGQLIDWLMEQAKANGCETLELDSGVQRFDAHRFYFAKRMQISSYHFRVKTSP